MAIRSMFAFVRLLVQEGFAFPAGRDTRRNARLQNSVSFSHPPKWNHLLPVMASQDSIRPEIAQDFISGQQGESGDRGLEQVES